MLSATGSDHVEAALAKVLHRVMELTEPGRVDVRDEGQPTR
jgi:hypothetical protein